MKTLFYNPNFPNVTAMELDRIQEMDEQVLRKELERLISLEQPQVAINQAVDLLVLLEPPIDPEDLLRLMMESDEIQILLRETKGTMMFPATEEVKEEYQEKTLLSFLIDLTNWLETR